MTSVSSALALQTFVPMLRTLSALLEKAAAHAEAKKFDPSVLVNARLAPDMFPLSRQVQIACDQAKNHTARLIGREAPRFEDTEQTIAELVARIARTVDHLESLPADAFEGADERDVTMNLPGELMLEMKGLRYLRDWALPQFYFHLVTAYAILRHNGVEIGKRDYMSQVADAIRPRA